jgi:hypothetical protein
MKVAMSYEATLKSRQDAAKAIPLTDKRACEKIIPAFIIALALEEMKKRGHEIRPDFLEHLNRAQELGLAGRDQVSQLRIAKRVDRDVTAATKDARNTDDTRTWAIAVVRFVLALADKGCLQDPGNVAVLIALAILDEAKGDGSQDWAYETDKGLAISDRLLTRFRLLGYFHDDVRLAGAR